MAHEHGPIEIWRCRIGKLAGIGFDPSDKLRDGFGRVRRFGTIIAKGKLRLGPWHFAACNRHTKIISDGRIIPVDQSVIRQTFGIAAPDKPALHHSAEILTVDPDQINRTCIHYASFLFAKDDIHRLCRVRQSNAVQRNVIVALQYVTNIVRYILVDVVGPTP